MRSNPTAEAPSHEPIDDRVDPLRNEQLSFMRQQSVVVVGYMVFSTVLAIVAPGILGGTGSLAWLLLCFTCTLSLPTAFVLAWRRSSTFRARALALDLGPIVLLETGRILGLAILIEYQLGELPGAFALWGGGVDVLIGATALTVAYWAMAVRPFPRRLFLGWNFFGLFDFIVAWPIIFLFSATSLGVLAGDGPTTEAFLKFPMSFIPMFGVPFTASIHLLAIMQVRHLGEPNSTLLFRRRPFAVPPTNGTRVEAASS
jgi:hypothetical protein